MFYSKLVREHSCNHLLSSRINVVMKYFQFLEKQILVSIQESSVLHNLLHGLICSSCGLNLVNMSKH